jgi:hypothetical protein
MEKFFGDWVIRTYLNDYLEFFSDFDGNFGYKGIKY